MQVIEGCHRSCTPLSAMRDVQQSLPDDLARVRGEQPCAFLEAVREPHRTWSQGHFVLQCYQELVQHHGHMELTRDVLLGQGQPASACP